MAARSFEAILRNLTNYINEQDRLITNILKVAIDWYI